MFNVHFTKRLPEYIGHHSQDVYLYRDMELPFPPFIGLTVCSGDFGQEIEGLAWDDDLEQFHTHSEDPLLREQRIRNGLDSDEIETLFTLALGYVEMGWTIRRDHEKAIDLAGQVDKAIAEARDA